MAGLNKVMLIGNLEVDPYIRYTQQGFAIVDFSIAISEQCVDKNTGDRKEKTGSYNIVVFGTQGEECVQYLSKGMQVIIEGELSTSPYEKEGQIRYSTDIIASKVQNLNTIQEKQGTVGYRSEDPVSQNDNKSSNMNLVDFLIVGKKIYENMDEIFPSGVIIKTDIGDYFAGTVNGQFEWRELAVKVEMDEGMQPTRLDLRSEFLDFHFPLKIPYSNYQGFLYGDSGNMIIHEDGQFEFDIELIS